MADDKVGLHKGYEHWVSPAPLNEDWDKDLEFVLIRTLDDLRVHDVEHKFVAWDTETSGLNPEMDWIVGFSFSFDGKTGYYVPVKHDDIALGKEALDIFYSILKKAGTQLLYNCRFDQRFMEYAGYNLEGLPYYDAMNAIWLADTNMVLPSLKGSERHYMGWTPKTFSETLGDATTFQHVPAEDAYKYACLVGETEVCMSDKILKKIADIQVGDVVQTMQGNKQVTAVYDNGTRSVCKLAFMDGTVIYATKDHKFLVWINSMQRDWMTVEQIMSSSRQHYIRLVTLNDDGSLDSLRIDLYASTLDAEERRVYDIQVKDVHNFRLANGIISHNCTDAIGTYKIAMISNRYYVENKPASKYDNDMLYPLMRLENTPQRLDTEYLLSLRPQVDETIERTKAEVYRLAGQEFNLNSPQQFGKILVERFAVDTGARTATGSMKADLKTVDAWLTKHSATVAQDVKDFLKAYKEYKKTVKFKSAYLEKYIKAAQEQDKFPVRFSYKVQSVPTGRLSCGADAKNSFFTKNNVQCLEENTEVLTSEGIKPIKDIVTGELVWSGSAFVPCVQLGSKQKRCETIWTYFGKITASLEHKFYTLNLLTFELEWECLGNAISCGKPLVRNTNDGGFTFRELLENEMFKKSMLLKPELSEERIKELEETYEDVRFDMIRKADNFWYPNIIPPEVTVYDLCVPTYERFTANGFIVHNSTPKPHAIMLKGRKATEQEIAEKKDILGWYFSNDIPDEEAKGLVEGMEPGNLNIRRAFLPENDQCYVVSIDMCLEGGSPVQTKRGYMGICEMKPGDEVWSPQGWVPVSRVMRTGVEKVIKVFPDNGGQAIYCTENHPFVINGEKVKAKDIKGKVPSVPFHAYVKESVERNKVMECLSCLKQCKTIKDASHYVLEHDLKPVIVDALETYTRAEVSVWCGILVSSFGHFMNALGIQPSGKAFRYMQSRFYNNVFAGESTPTSAYLFGFILGDGNISRRRGDYLTLNISSKDEAHLRQICNIFGEDLNIRHNEKKGCEWWTLDIPSRDICNRLLELGISERKSTEPSHVNFEWLGDNFRHFIRGVFDSDGYVRITSVLDVSFVGHDSYITEIKKRIEGKWSYKYTPSLSHLSLLGTVEQRKFIYAYLYQEATIWLQRKRDIIESWYQDKFGDLVFPVWNCTVDTTEHLYLSNSVPTSNCAEELRIVANLCHEDTWIHAFNSGADVHKACYSPDTEFMTERGWLTADKITPDMKIAYYDDKTDSVKFTRADKRCTNDATEVYSREGTFDVTDNHRMYVRCANEESYGIVLAKDLKSKGNPRQKFAMKVSMGNPIDFGYVMKSILDPIFFMSGFVIASKHEIKDDRIHITLCHPCLSMPYFVLSMVDGSNIRTTSLTLTKEATHRLSVNGFLRSSETLLSHVVEMFSQDNGTVKKDFTQQMVCGLVYGLASREDSELHIGNGDGIHGRVYIEDKSLADVIQWALTLNGISCHCVYGKVKKKYVLHVKTLRDNAIGMSYHSVKKQNVAGKNLVYSCFTVPSGLLVTRYHGRITVNGNTAIKLFGEENYSKDARKKAKCVAGDTILHTADGHTIAIRDLVSVETRKNAVIGEPVELPEPKTRISTPDGWSPVTHWISNGKKDTLKLIIERKLTLEVTPDHLVGKYDPDVSDDLSKKYRLVRADSLSVGHYVLWDYCPMRITDIQKGSSDVYDITVDNASHTFHANGVVVHNCASFGILYGSGAQGFNNSFPDMTLDECREFMTKFKAALPNITSGQQAYVEHAKIYGCVPTAFGRMRRVRWFLQSGDRAKVAFGERTVKNCYSPDTEFLTKDGWKLAKDILPDTQLAYYVPEKKVIRYTNAGERYTHRCTESVVYHSVSGAWNVTTNHRMWVSKNGNDFESVVADKLCDMDKFTVITSSFMDDENAKHKHDETAFTIDGKSFTFEDMAFLLGVCIRRGVITYGNGGGSRDGVLTVACDVSQTPVMDRLKRTFGTLLKETKRLQAGKYLKLIRFGVSLRDYVKENIGKTRKAFHVPAWISDADTLTVEAFIAGVVGQKMIEHPNELFTFRTHDKKLADDIQRLCTMCGFFTRLMSNKDANGKNAFTMHIQRMTLRIIGNYKRDEYRQRPVHKVTHEEMEYSCFEVPSHILVTRYRGFVSYHMNTTVQGTAADVLKLIFCRLWKKVFKPYPQVKFMSTIHDEVNFSIPIELAREVIPICMECMTINRSDWPVTLKCSLSVSRTDLGSLVPFTYDFEHDTYEPEWDTLDVKPKKKEEPKLVAAVPDETKQDEAEMELHFEFLTDEDMLF